ncbi:HTH domain-containing protein [Bacillus cereus group sp. LD113LC]|uniref:HTH domain-containing protein n=1 Tax=Bacillus cereus group TaxID=86661 RepID=UPI0019627B64|nr:MULTISPECIES: HTH domain-containing protein [Bacillus cereus group]HDR3647212.1 HTH domain-containing protein [Bacillus paranthracis]MCU5562399.1 HTH domain-containing protein [Bacillus pacificus]MDA1625807.1 HTH domain-containing protein [Bacillus cereus group sp. TH206-1LC]MDA1753026.1 HTH domain-containing protein [Bacillus cereus group sp. LD113LC]MDX5917474.1 HTH domain-containing protein [Bacillus cereus group sp. BfR-BA-01026]
MNNNSNNVNGLVQFVTKTELKNKAKKAEKIERPELQLTLEEATERAQNMINFLKVVHPGNTGGGFKKAIEIKFLLRGKGASYNFYKPTLLFDLDADKTLEILAKAFHENSCYSHCCYYTLYNFDNTKEVRVETIDSNGRKTYKYIPVKKIEYGNVHETWTLPIDIDNISKEEYKEYREYLLSLGIETIGIFTGNGYQMLILLDKPFKMKVLYQQFTTKLHKLIPAIDTSINVPTQVFRSLYTRNCKEYSDQFKYYKPYDPQPKEVVLMDWTEKRYSRKQVFEILDEEIERKFNKEEVVSSEDVDSKVQEKGTVETTVTVTSSRSEVITADKTYQDLYKHVNFGELPLNIQKILQGTTEGLRNRCVLYLTPFLNNQLGLTQEQALETLEVFNNLCTPPKPMAAVRSDYYRISEDYGSYRKGKYDQGMVEAFGKEEELNALIRADFNKILFDNEVIKKFNVIHHTAIRLYLGMKLLEIEEEKNSFTQEEIAKAARVSERTVQRYIKELTRFSIVVNVKGNNKKGIKKGYKINRFGQFINGFTKLNKSLVKTMLLELEHSELIVYIYMMFKVNAMNETFVFTSQTQIALDVGLKQTRISEVTDILQEKKYIKKKTVMGKQNRKKTTYTLKEE